MATDWLTLSFHPLGAYILEMKSFAPNSLEAGCYQCIQNTALAKAAPIA